MKSGQSDATRDFSARASIAEATAWIDEHVARLGAEEVLLADAAGRVLAEDVAAAVDLPPFNRASVDGLAVRADETAGASAYNPLSLQVAAMSDALRANAGILLSAGDPFPIAADAVVPLGHIEHGLSGSCEIIEAVAPGSGVERKASEFALGATLLKTGRILGPYDIGLLAAAGVAHLQVVRRPRVLCFLLASTSPAGILHDANGPLLRELVRRDGSTVAELHEIERDSAAIRGALAAPESDVVIVVGGTGWGSADASAAALAGSGELAIRGVALRPGETACLGRTANCAPVFLLPGAPTSCLWTYELFAGRAIRRRGGRNPALPFCMREMTTARKIVSAIGMTEVCPVRCLSHDRIEPIASFAEAGLAAVARADGFVIITEGSEGVPEGAIVTVHLRQEVGHPAIDREADRKPCRKP